MDHVGDHDVRLQGDACGRPGIGQLLADHGVVAVVQVQAAIGLRDLRAEQAGIATGQPEGPVDDTFFLPPVQVGRQVLGEDLADLPPKDLQVLVEKGAS